MGRSARADRHDRPDTPSNALFMKLSSIVAVLVVAGAACYYFDVATAVGWKESAPLPETIADPDASFAVDADTNPYFRN